LASEQLDKHGILPGKTVTSTDRIAYRFAIYGVILISTAVYLPSVDGLALWDDRSLIGVYRSFSQCLALPFLQHYFRPLVSLTFFVEWRLFGRDAFVCHQTNILIHLCTTAALIGLLRALLPNRWIAALGGLLFAIQPAQASTVAWIGGRTDSLCTLWLTLFLLCLVRSAQSRGTRAWYYGAISVTLFELALLTKEQSLAVLPIVPMVYLWFHNTVVPKAQEVAHEPSPHSAQNWGAGGRTQDSGPWARIQNRETGGRPQSWWPGWRRALLCTLPFLASAILFLTLGS